DQDLETHLGHELHLVLGAPVDLGVPALAAEALDLTDRHALHADLLEGLAYVVELERLDDSCDELHRPPPSQVVSSVDAVIPVGGRATSGPPPPPPAPAERMLAPWSALASAPEREPTRSSTRSSG